MQALSRHLRPAPYPYGLLTLRLLGKLGGKNRRFLREPIDVCNEAMILDTRGFPLSLRGTWQSSESDPPEEALKISSCGFTLPLPLARCVETLKLLAATEGAKETERKALAPSEMDGAQPVLWNESEKLWNMNVEDVDFSVYCQDVMEATRKSQALATFRVILSALAATLPVIDATNCTFEDSEVAGSDVSDKMELDGETESTGLSYNTDQIESRNKEFVNMSLGVMYACIVESTWAKKHS